MDMTNIAYSPEYRALRHQADERGAGVLPGTPEHLVLGDGFTADRYSHPGTNCTTTVVFDGDAKEAYRWTNVDDDAEFVTLVNHSGGRTYLVFRVDLYGYGVAHLATGRDFFYVPKGPETFIWTAIHYTPVTDVLAVEGCFWACPFGLHLVDFRDPMVESKWVDVIDLLEGDYDRYDDVTFVEWDAGTLVVDAGRIVDKARVVPERLRLESDACLARLR